MSILTDIRLTTNDCREASEIVNFCIDAEICCAVRKDSNKPINLHIFNIQSGKFTSRAIFNKIELIMDDI